ncbi:MAG: hypothetical protein H6Q69_2804, partial [Firmicutes bacterium]|nr:hypothetical protein [Bacillota bacterium]
LPKALDFPCFQVGIHEIHSFFNEYLEFLIIFFDRGASQTEL